MAKKDSFRQLLIADLALAAGIVKPHEVAGALMSAWKDDRDDFPLLDELTRMANVAPDALRAVEREADALIAGAKGDARIALSRHGGLDRSILASARGGEVTRALAKVGTHVRAPLRRVPDGRYMAFEEAGKGGMGVVYMALDTELNRRVAFKIIRPDAAEPTARDEDSPLEAQRPEKDTPAEAAFEELKARFLQEAWVTGGLEHPGIVPVYELGQTKGGAPYYTMRFVRGNTTLADAIEEVRDGSIEDRLPLIEPFLKLCDALRYAHAKDVVHRDLKPANVALGEFGEVVLLDWGLAKLSGREDVVGSLWQGKVHAFRQAADFATMADALGTPGYMAPEAAIGKIDQIDVRSDVYSLGAILFEILTGHVPVPYHRGEPYPEFAKRIAGEDAPTARTLDDAVPEALSTICAGALARAPADRPQTVEAFSAAIRAWQVQSAKDREAENLLQAARASLAAAGEATGDVRLRQVDRAAAAIARVETIGASEGVVVDLRTKCLALREEGIRQREKASTRKLLVRGGVGVLAAATVAAIWVAGALNKRNQQVQSERDAKAAALGQETAARERERQERLEKERALEKQGMLLKTVSAERSQRDRALRAVREVNDAILRGNDLAARDRHEAAASQYLAAVQTLDELFPEGSRTTALALTKAADARLAANGRADVRPLRQRATAILRARETREPTEWTEALERLAEAHIAASQYDQALSLRREVADVWRSQEPESPRLGAALLRVALIHDARGQRLEGLPLKRQALSMLETGHDGDHPDVAHCLEELASSLMFLGSPGEAEPLFEESLAIRRRLLASRKERELESTRKRNNEDHPDVVRTLSNLGANHLLMGRSSNAVEVLVDALERARRVYQGDHPMVVQILGTLGSALRDGGRHEEALAHHEEALAMAQRLFDADHPVVARALHDMASTLSALGRAKEALPSHEQALAMSQRVFPGDHPLVALSMAGLADCLVLLKRPDEAKARFESRLAMVMRLFEGGHPVVADALMDLATMHDESGDMATAVKMRGEAVDILRTKIRSDDPRLAQGLEALGRSFLRIGLVAGALTSFEEALAMRRKLHSGDHSDVANALIGLGDSWTALGDPTAALPLLAAALEMSRRLAKGEDDAGTVSALNALGRTLVELGRTDEALALAEESASMAERLTSKDDPLVATCLLHLGRACRRKGQIEPALQAVGRALAIGKRLAGADHEELLGACHREIGLAKVGQGADLEAETSLRRAVDLRDRHAPIALADLLMKTGRLDDAVLLLEGEASRWDEEREPNHQRLALDERVVFERSRKERNPYAKLVDAYIEQGNLEKALTNLERGRGRVLLDLLSFDLKQASEAVRAQGDERARQVTETQVAVDEARSALVDARQRVDVARSAGSRRVIVAARRNELESIEKLRRATWLFREKLLPLLTSGRPVSAKEVLAALEDGELLLAYHLGARRAHVLTVSKDGIQAVQLKADGRAASRRLVEDTAAQYRNAISEWGAGASANKHGAALFRMLFPEQVWQAARSAKRVLVMRGGKLARLPLEALVVEGDTGETQYLVEKAPPLAYVSSGSLLATLRTRPRVPNQGAKTVALGDPRFGHRLSATGAEVRGIEEVVRSSGRSATVKLLLEGEATERALFEAAPAAHVLHIATHCLVEPGRGTRASRLALTPPQAPIHGDDGFLTLGDLLDDWSRRLEGVGLVVTSAVDAWDESRGYTGISGGFLAAGARSTIAAHWNVDDRATSKLMIELYRQMFQAETPMPCEALHAAKKVIMKEYPDPYYWAPFVFFGAP